MAKYLIHAYPPRMWYVTQYLVPSMLKQGIEEVNITIYNDSKGEGNLRSCLNAFASCDGNGGTWHIQDDVIICHNFKERTEQYDNGIVCGFSSYFDGWHNQNAGPGTINNSRMWFSFPCIRIPNQYARECAEWVDKYIIGNFAYEDKWKKGVNDDWCFREFMKTNYPNEMAINLAPNLVDHIDYLLGGGSGGKRSRPVRAVYWEDIDLVKELENKINGRTQD